MTKPPPAVARDDLLMLVLQGRWPFAEDPSLSLEWPQHLLYLSCAMLFLDALTDK